MEAALQIDVREAAKIVYDAVGSDASEPSKTYQNAAQALLDELRARSGLTRRMRVGTFDDRPGVGTYVAQTQSQAGAIRADQDR
jgi:hypothetical protein